jgi:hypothetical protein
MLAKLKRRYFWPGMRTDIQQWVLSCDECASRSGYNLKKNKMKKYRVGAPMERVAMDVLGPLPRSTKGNHYILVIGDYFTKWIEAVCIPNQLATTVADVLVNQFIARYGVPLEIHTDQGRNFESEVQKEVCRMLGINKTRTTAFRPQSDGFIERFNRTLMQIVVLYTGPQQTDWDRVVPLAVAAYRATPQDTTGQSPNLLMLGREVTMPVDLLMGSPPGEEPTDVTEYGQQMRKQMEHIFQIVRIASGRAMNRQKKLYDRNKVDDRHTPGAKVWLAVKNRTKGKCPKLERKWKGPLLVVERYSDVTYLVAEGPTKQKVIHFDRLKKYHGEKNPTWMKTLMKERREEQDRCTREGRAYNPHRSGREGARDEPAPEKEEDFGSASDDSDFE